MEQKFHQDVDSSPGSWGVQFRLLTDPGRSSSITVKALAYVARGNRVRDAGINEEYSIMECGNKIDT